MYIYIFDGNLQYHFSSAITLGLYDVYSIMIIMLIFYGGLLIIMAAIWYYAIFVAGQAFIL